VTEDDNESLAVPPDSHESHMPVLEENNVSLELSFGSLQLSAAGKVETSENSNQKTSKKSLQKRKGTVSLDVLTIILRENLFT
jgi:hypothetical protein